MVRAMRHGVLVYEAMGLNRRIPDSSYGVLICAATRRKWVEQISLATIPESIHPPVGEYTLDEN